MPDCAACFKCCQVSYASFVLPTAVDDDRDVAGVGAFDGLEKDLDAAEVTDRVARPAIWVPSHNGAVPAGAQRMRPAVIISSLAAAVPTAS